MSKRFDKGSAPSNRQLRVGENIRHALADILRRGDVMDPVLESHVVTVPQVKMTPDLKLATCFVMPLGGKDVDAVVEALERNKRFLRGELAHRLSMKYMPDLRFRADESFETGERMDALLASPDVSRDTGKKAE